MGFFTIKGDPCHLAGTGKNSLPECQAAQCCGIKRREWVEWVSLDATSTRGLVQESLVERGVMRDDNGARATGTFNLCPDCVERTC